MSQTVSAAPWDLPNGSEIGGTPLQAADFAKRVAVTPADVTGKLRLNGLTVLGVEACPVDLFGRAYGLIRLVPQLCAIVAAVVENIHILSAAPGYDISHSEPCWRSSIFVSVPERDDDVGALRLAESIIHEAMHLHLTNLEALSRLVSDVAGVMASPWRTEARPYQGVLHGLFVFSCLAVYFERVLSGTELVPSARLHVRQRHCDILIEIASIDLDSLCSGLTPEGVELARRWRTRALDY